MLVGGGKGRTVDGAFGGLGELDGWVDGWWLLVGLVERV